MNEAALQAAARRAARRLGLRPQDVARVLRNELSRLLHGESAAGAAPATAPVLPPAAAAARVPAVRWVLPDERGGSYVRVPYLAKAEHAKPLQRVVAYAADKLGMSHHLAAKVAAYLFEGVADEAALGRVVRVPGFGAFGPWLWIAKDGGQTVYPRFVAARPFRLQVRSLCQPADAKNDVLRNLQRSHHPSSRLGKPGARTWAAMHAWRQDIDRQAGYEVRAGDE